MFPKQIRRENKDLSQKENWTKCVTASISMARMTLILMSTTEKGEGYISEVWGIISKKNRHFLHFLSYSVFHSVRDQTQSPVHVGGCSTTELYSSAQQISFYINIIMEG